MFKKLFLILLLSIVSITYVFANGGTYINAKPCVPDAYVGVAVSRDLFHVVPPNNEARTNRGNNGWDGELNAGYGWHIHNHYYLGAEIFGDISSMRTVYMTSVRKLNNNWGIDFVPGIQVSNSTMLYGKIGFVQGRFRRSSDETGMRVSQSESSDALQLGIGLQTMITKCISAKMEYDWNDYARFDTKAKGELDAFKFGIAYHFLSA